MMSLERAGQVKKGMGKVLVLFSAVKTGWGANSSVFAFFVQRFLRGDVLRGVFAWSFQFFGEEFVECMWISVGGGFCRDDVIRVRGDWGLYGWFAGNPVMPLGLRESFFASSFWFKRTLQGFVLVLWLEGDCGSWLFIRSRSGKWSFVRVGSGDEGGGLGASKANVIYLEKGRLWKKAFGNLNNRSVDPAHDRAIRKAGFKLPLVGKEEERKQMI